MKIAYLSSLDSSVNSGGAYLRIEAIKHIYKELEIQVDSFYSNDATEEKGLRGLSHYLKILKYGYKPLILFKSKKIDLSKYDIVHFDNLRQFSWDIKLKQNAKIIYNAHNLECENYFQREDNTHSQNFLDHEINCIKKSNLTLVCSKREKSYLVKKDKTIENKIVVIPNLIRKEDYYFSEIKKSILFLGTLDYYPNIKAVEYLTSTFSDYIKNNSPELVDKYNFVIAGRNPQDKQFEMIENSIFTLQKDLTKEEVLGLLSCTYMNLVPLRHGSGTRLKIIEAIMSKSLVLSTELGSEGIVNENIKTCDESNFHEEFIKLMKEENEFNDKSLVEFYKDFDLKTWMTYNSASLKKKVLEL